MVQVSVPTRKPESEAPQSNDVACFVTTEAAGRDMRLVLKAAESQMVKVPGSDVPRLVDVQTTAKVVRFSEGKYSTADPEIIGLMLSSKYYGTHFKEDPLDPSGYWRKVGVMVEEEVRTTRIKRAS